MLDEFEWRGRGGGGVMLVRYNGLRNNGSNFWKILFLHESIFSNLLHFRDEGDRFLEEESEI